MDPEKRIGKRIGQAIFNYQMIVPHDKILVAVSGGKDSMTLLYDLMRRQKSFPIPYKLEAVHIKTDFCSCCAKTDLENKLKEWQVPYRIVDVPILKRVKPGQKMNCYWCSTQRRLELLKIAQADGFTKIALGHHMDDIIETLFMNICYKSEIATMLPVFAYHKFPQTVIRPLALVSENLIRRFAREKGILELVCKCPYGTNSKRKKIRAMIRELAGNDDSIRYGIFKAMHNVNLDYLVPATKAGKRAPGQPPPESPV